MEVEFSESALRDIDGALEEDGLKKKFRRKLMALKIRASDVPLTPDDSSVTVEDSPD